MSAVRYETRERIAYITLNWPEHAREGPRAFREKQKPQFQGR